MFWFGLALGLFLGVAAGYLLWWDDEGYHLW